VDKFAVYHQRRFGEGAPVLPVHVTEFLRFVASHWGTPGWQQERAGAALRQHFGFRAEASTPAQEPVVGVASPLPASFPPTVAPASAGAILVRSRHGPVPLARSSRRVRCSETLARYAATGRSTCGPHSLMAAAISASVIARTGSAFAFVFMQARPAPPQRPARGDETLLCSAHTPR
jgi:hypothetical protein